MTILAVPIIQIMRIIIVIIGDNNNILLQGQKILEDYICCVTSSEPESQ